MPTASPSWRAVLLIPDASPPWAGGSTPRWAKVTIGLASPVPTPTTESPASRCSHDESASMPVISSSPRRAQPHADRERCGQRDAPGEPAGEERGRERERARAARATGRPRPGCRPPTSSRNSDRYTKTPNDPPASVATITVAPRNVRFRNRRRSSIGSAARSSTRTNAASETAPDRDQAEHRRARPAQRVAAQHREDDQEEPERQRPDAGPVDRARIRVLRLAHLGQRQRDRRQPEHDAEREDRLPADRVDEHAADQRPGRERQPDHRAPDPDRAGARLALELLREQRQRGREHDRGARAPAAPARRSAARTTEASVHSAEATVNRHTPITNSFLRPNRSASEPAVSWKTASTSE